MVTAHCGTASDISDMSLLFWDNDWIPPRKHVKLHVRTTSYAIRHECGSVKQCDQVLQGAAAVLPSKKQIVTSSFMDCLLQHGN